VICSVNAVYARDIVGLVNTKNHGHQYNNKVRHIQRLLLNKDYTTYNNVQSSNSVSTRK